MYAKHCRMYVIYFKKFFLQYTRGGSRGRGARAPYFWQSQFYFLHCIQCLKNIFEIEFGFHSGRNPRSFWKCGGCTRVCVNRNRGRYCFFLLCKGPFWMISEAILIPKIYARLQEIASNFSKFSGKALQTHRRRSRLRHSVRGFAPLLGPLFPKFLDPPLYTVAMLHFGVYISWLYALWYKSVGGYF